MSGVGGIGGAVVVVILTLYFTASMNEFKAALYRVVPMTRRAQFSSIAEQIWDSREHNFRRLTLAVASWFRYLYGVNEQGKPYSIDAPMAEELKAHVRERLGGVAKLSRRFGDPPQ